MALKTKRRINSRVRLNAKNQKGKGKKSNSSFLTKIQSKNKKEVPNTLAYGFCLLHSNNVGKEKFEFKNCIDCKYFVNYKNK